MSTKAQRPPAEVRFADELAALVEADTGPRPPGWQLSLTAVRAFLIGDAHLGTSPKFVGDPALVERAMVSLVTQRGLLLIGEPGTAKSMLSELLAADPQHIGALRHLARLAMKKGNDALARQCLERILKLRTGDLEAQQSLRNLDALGTIKKGFAA